MKRKKKERRGGAGRNQGRKAQDGAEGLLRFNIMLDPDSLERARSLGEGNVSLGIRKAIAEAAA